MLNNAMTVGTAANDNSAQDFKAGDAVSYSFNGDRYTTIVIRATARTLTVGDGQKFTLREDGKWRSVGRGTWLLRRNTEGLTAKMAAEF
jgi:hypothetical protein